MVYHLIEQCLFSTHFTYPTVIDSLQQVSEFDLFTLDDIDSAFQNITRLTYSQNYHMSGKFSLRLSLHQSLFSKSFWCLGTLWVVSFIISVNSIPLCCFSSFKIYFIVRLILLVYLVREECKRGDAAHHVLLYHLRWHLCNDITYNSDFIYCYCRHK